MPAVNGARLITVRSRGQWRRWLARNHDKLDEAWLVFFKQHTGEPSLGYDEAVEEALCFGWVDSLVKVITTVPGTMSITFLGDACCHR